MQLCKQQLLAIGKLPRGAPVVSSAAPHDDRQGDLLHFQDPITKKRWLIDGGAFVSLVPPTLAQRAAGPVGTRLQAANGTEIPCYGSIRENVSLGNRVYQYDFIVADVSQPIIGADFLAENYIAPNHRDGNLIDLNDLSIIQQAEPDANCTPLGINFVDQKASPYYQLLDKFPNLSKPSFTPGEVKHGVRHHIPTNGYPVQSKARKLSPEKLQAAKEQMESYVKLGIARRGKSEWASPILVTGKKDGGWRVCGDFRRLNCQTVDDKYPVKSLSDFNSDLQGKTIFSKVDLLKGYHQIPVAEEDIPKTGVITPFGLFVFPRTPFGLKNAGQDFQRLMDEILDGVPHVYVYIDDILVSSHSVEEHLQDLERLFTILNDNGLVVNRAKCSFGQSSLEFLGYQVDKDGVRPLPERVVAIQETSPPTSVTELRRYLGMLNYYRRFIPHAAQHLCPLFDALKGNPKKLVWSAQCQEAFENSKAALASAAMLHHPRVGAQLALTSDASKVAVGAVLEQRGPMGWEPLGYYSSKLSKDKPNQTLWPPFDRELLGVFRAVRHFRHMIEGQSFTIYTDQQALVPSLHKKSDPLTARQAYQLSCIAEFSTDIRYLEGKANVVADALSRPNGLDVNSILGTQTHLFLQLMLINSIVPANNEGSTPFGTTPPTNTLGSIPIGATPITSTASDPTGGVPTRHNHANPTPGVLSPSVISSSNPPAHSLSNSGSPSTPISHIDRPLSEEKRHDFGQVVAAVENLNIDLAKMAAEQPLDQDFQRISTEARSGLNFRRIDIGNSELIVDVSNGLPRPFVPLSMRREVFEAIHGLGHPGTHRTAQIAASKFVWPNIKSDCTRWAKECIPCQRSKVTKNTTPAIGHFEVPNRRFSHIHVDIVTLTPSNGFSHLFTIVDRFTRWPAAIPIRDMSAESVLDAFSHGWVAHYGLPSAVTSDRGSQFTGALWEQLLAHWGIKVLHTAAYHPEANGLVERLHRRLKESLLALCNHNPHEWFWRLPAALLSIRTTLKPDLGSSPADLVYGEGLAVPGDLHGAFPSDPPELLRQRQAAQANLRLEISRMQPIPTSAHRRPTIYIPPDLADATHVFVRRGGVQSSFSTPYEGPYRVVERQDSGYRVLLPGGRSETIALARLKPAHVDIDDSLEDPDQRLDDARPPSPRPPGRPPGPRTRLPQPTDRVTRQQSRRQQSNQGATDTDSIPAVPVGRPQDAATSSARQPVAGSSKASRSNRSVRFAPTSSNLDSDPPASSAPPNIRRPARHLVAPTPSVPQQNSPDPSSPTPPTSLPAPTRRRRRRGARDISEYNSLPRVAEEQPIANEPILREPAVEDPVVDQSSSAPNSPRTAERLRQLRADAYVSEQLFDQEDDPSSQPSLFELGDIVLPVPNSSTAAASTSSAAAPQPQPQSSLGLAQHASLRRDEGGNVPAAPASLGPVRFSAKRDGYEGRRFFSDDRKSSTRRRPDVSVIFEHLGMTSSSLASGHQPLSSGLSAGGRVDVGCVTSSYHPPTALNHHQDSSLSYTQSSDRVSSSSDL